MNIIEKAIEARARAAEQRTQESRTQESRTEGARAEEEQVTSSGQAPVSEAAPAVLPPHAARAAPREDAPPVVPFQRLWTDGFVPADPDEPGLLSELRHLKRSILQAAFGPLAEAGANVAVITSPMPGAGKTYLSAALTRAMARERDRSTLLIDADDARASISRALGLQGRAGLFDCLHDNRIGFESLVLPSDMDKLRFVPAGRQHADSLELLTSSRAAELFSRVARSNPDQLVVIDCPPLLGTPNAAALAALAGQILVVVEAGETNSSSLNHALELLPRDKPIGLVLNKVPRSPLLGLSGGGYYYYGPVHQ